MHFLSSLVVLSYLSFVYSSPVIPASESLLFGSTNPQNANHIFNALHSSMRQWGSSLNHNGMSFFLATVPAGTQLYHGTAKKEAIQGIEWLAFEPEHALLFARAWRGPRRPPSEEGDDGKGGRHEEGHGPDDGEYWRGPNFTPPGDDQEHLDAHHGRPHLPPPPPSGPPHEPPFEHHGPPPPRPPPGHGKPPMHHMPPPPPPPPPSHGKPPTHDMPPPPPPPHNRPPPEHDMPRPPPPPSHGKPPKHDMPPPPHHRPPPEHGAPGPPKPPQGQPPFGHPPNSKPFHEPPHRRERKVPQHPIKGAAPGSDNPQPLPGYLHTYVPLQDLHLLYIDGMSAGKTTNGTLDTQDILLLNLTSDQCQGMMCERERARGLCDMAKGVWQDKVDGVLRMEGGFEIILCDFERDLERVDVMKIVEGGNNGADRRMIDGWRYTQAVADRYHGIGGGRVAIDYDHFVTVFDYPDLDLFTNDVNSDMPMPRLQNVGDSDLIQIRDAVTQMVLARDGDKTSDGTNWQEVVDTVVKRYSKALHYLASSSELRDSKESFAEYLSALLRPFIDWTARNSTQEIARCGAQLVPRLQTPPAPAPSLAHRAAYTVNTEICFALLSALDVTLQSMSHSLSHGAPPTRALDLVDSLVNYLQWTTWKDCGACLDDEVCVIPIWPMGSFEDHAHPQCKSENGGMGMGDYWGHGWRHGPPPPEEGPGGGRGRESGRGHGVERGGVGRMQLHHKGCGKGGRALGWLRARISGVLQSLGWTW